MAIVDKNAAMSGATATVATDGTNITRVNITARSRNGSVLPGAIFDVFLSDSVAGVGLTATTASGTVVVKTAGTLGTDIADHIPKKYKRVQANAAGLYVLQITDTAKTAFKVCVVPPGTGRPRRVATLATASYG